MFKEACCEASACLHTELTIYRLTGYTVP